MQQSRRALRMQEVRAACPQAFNAEVSLHIRSDLLDTVIKNSRASI